MSEQPSNSASSCASAFGSAPRANRKLRCFPSTSSRSYPERERKLSLAKIIGLLGTFASVNTIGIRVVSAATTNGPRSFRKCSTSAFGVFLFFGLVRYLRHSANVSDPLAASALWHWRSGSRLCLRGAHRIGHDGAAYAE